MKASHDDSSSVTNLKNDHTKLTDPLTQIGSYIQYFKQEMTDGQNKKLTILHLNPYTLRQWGVMKFLDPDGKKMNFINYQRPQDALDFLDYIFKRKYSVDIIITDVRLPDFDGYEFAKKLRETEFEYGISPIPVLIISLLEEEHPLIQKGIKSNYFNSYLPQNSDSDKIFQVVNSLI